MSFSSLIGVELTKIRRSKIFLILLAPVLMMWLPSVINSDMIFDVRGVPITPENNFFIQGFMGMVWFMIPASLVICTVLLNQTERTNKGILKMLSLPISTVKMCLAKFTVLIMLAAVQMVMAIGAYYASAAIATGMQDYNFVLDPLYVCKNVLCIYIAAIPMAAVYWAISTLIRTTSAASLHGTPTASYFLSWYGIGVYRTLRADDKHKNLVCLSDELPILFTDD